MDFLFFHPIEEQTDHRSAMSASCLPPSIAI